MVDAFGYGQLDFILALTLPASKMFKLKEPELQVLAHITKAQGAEGDASNEFVSFTKMGHSVILDVTSVQSVAGRVLTSGTKEAGEWHVIDCSAEICQKVFQVPKHDYEGDN